MKIEYKCQICGTVRELEEGTTKKCIRCGGHLDKIKVVE